MPKVVVAADWEGCDVFHARQLHDLRGRDYSVSALLPVVTETVGYILTFSIYCKYVIKQYITGSWRPNTLDLTRQNESKDLL